MIKNNIEDLTGFGLSTKMEDNDYNILVVNVDKQVVEEWKEDRDNVPNSRDLSNIVNKQSFEKFVSS